MCVRLRAWRSDARLHSFFPRCQHAVWLHLAARGGRVGGNLDLGEPRQATSASPARSLCRRLTWPHGARFREDAAHPRKTQRSVIACQNPPLLNSCKNKQPLAQSSQPAIKGGRRTNPRRGQSGPLEAVLRTEEDVQPATGTFVRGSWNGWGSGQGVI